MTNEIPRSAPTAGDRGADLRRLRGVVIIGEGAEAHLARQASRRLGLRSRTASPQGLMTQPPVSEGVLITGAVALPESLESLRLLLTGGLAADPPVLLSAVAAADAAAHGLELRGVSASRLRFAPTVKAALATVGQFQRFRAVVDAPPPGMARDTSFWARPGSGVLTFLGADLLDLLSSLLNDPTVTEYRDDAQGGLAAEARLTLAAAGGVQGEIELSWLRTRGAWLELAGSRGQVRIDLADLRLGSGGGGEAAGQAEAARLRAWLDGSLSHGGAARLALSCAELRRPLVQSWEGEEHPAGRTLAGKRVLVVGASGFIGARLTEMLAAGGAEVTAAVRDSRRAARIARHPVNVVRLDLSDGTQVEQVVSGQQVVFSLAHDLDRSAAGNLAAYERLADAARRSGVERVVHTSSIAAYDGWPSGDLDEDSPRDASAYEYKDTKRAIERDLERRARAGQFTAAIVQPTIVYGPFSKLWTDRFAAWLRRAPVVLPAGGRGLCNGVYVDDLVQALIRAGAAEIGQAETFIVSGPAPFTWRELLDGYAEALGGVVDYEPERLGADAPARPPARPGAAARLVQRLLLEVRRLVRDRIGAERVEALRERFRRRAGAPYRPGDAEPALFEAQGVCSIEKARRQLGYAPAFGLKDGLARTNAYLSWRYGEDRPR